jgi:hypothetical protein
MNTKLNAELVDKIFMNSLSNDKDYASNRVMAEGITCTVWFSLTALKIYKNEIEEMLKDLPIEFQENGGGGMSFLNACNDKNGDQWTGLHQRMEQLFQLGIAIEKVKCLMPRDFWEMLPGGMPYYVVLN